ncbi:MAG: CsgE family curli-type amyloid fiber assembly protein [Pseudomonadota bacterium]
MNKLLHIWERAVLVALCVAMIQPGYAQDINAPDEINGARKRADRIDGLVTDQTITLLGHEFYRSFVNTWRDQSDGSRYNLAIYERPSARSASLVWVEYRFRKIYSGLVRMGKRSSLEEMGAGAAQAVRARIAEIEAETLFNTQDMAADEI